MYDPITELEHFGVPGMRWGVRKSRVSTSSGIRKKKQLTPEQREKRAALKKKAVKVAKGASLVGLGAVSVLALTNPTGERLIRGGAAAINAALRVRQGYTYRNIKSEKAQMLEQVLRGESDGVTFRNLQTDTEQMLQRHIREHAQ